MVSLGEEQCFASTAETTPLSGLLIYHRSFKNELYWKCNTFCFPGNAGFALPLLLRLREEREQIQSDLTALSVTNNTSMQAAPWLYHQKKSLIKDIKRQYPLWRLGASGKFLHCALKCHGLISKAMRTVLPCQERGWTSRGKRQLNHQNWAE